MSQRRLEVSFHQICDKSSKIRMETAKIAAGSSWYARLETPGMRPMPEPLQVWIDISMETLETKHGDQLG
jgi:hypothetical protein